MIWFNGDSPLARYFSGIRTFHQSLFLGLFPPNRVLHVKPDFDPPTRLLLFCRPPDRCDVKCPFHGESKPRLSHVAAGALNVIFRPRTILGKIEHETIRWRDVPIGNE